MVEFNKMCIAKGHLGVFIALLYLKNIIMILKTD